MKKLFLLLAVVSTAVLSAAELPQFLKVDNKNAMITLKPGLVFRMVHFGKGWSGSWQGNLKLEKGFPVTENGALKFCGKMRAGGSRNWMDFKEKLSSSGSSGFFWEGELKAAEPVFTLGCALETMLPASGKELLLINGKPLVMPQVRGTAILYDRPMKNLVIVTVDAVYRIESACNLFVQDRRGKGLTVRLSPVGVPRQMKSWQLKLKISVPSPEEIKKYQKIEPPSSSVVTAGKEWIPLEFFTQVIKGSPLDFSNRLDAPAGKYGAITVSKDGHFSFAGAPDKRIRFTGVNLVGFSCFLPHNEADILVEKFAALGYNSVRLHHFDNPLADQDSPDSGTVSLKQLDKLHYLTYKLKERGIYTTIDLYCSRRIRPGDKFRHKNYKAGIHVEPAIKENWKKFVRTMLCTKNPYTGMSWADDPALFAVNLVNEGALIQRYNATPELKRHFEAEFEKYLSKNPGVLEGKTRQGAFVSFLNRIQSRTMRELISFLRNDLKIKALITDLNYPGNATLSGMRKMFDFVDTHDYWDHPKHPNGWRLPFDYHGRSALRREGEIMRWIMPRRVFGKPFTVTEFNYCQPNPHRMEAAPLFGGYAALQDWDGIWRFVWTESYAPTRKTGAPKVFEIIHDPQAQLAERIIHMLFRRRDVRPAPGRAAFRFSDKWVDSLTDVPGRAGHYPSEFGRLGLFTRIGTVLEGDKNIPQDSFNPEAFVKNSSVPERLRRAVEKDRIVSETGEITLAHKQGSMSVITPRSEVLTLKGTLAGKFMKVTQADKLQIVALMSLDDLPLDQSRRLLLIHLPDLSAEGRTFNNKSHTQVQHWGRLPLLLQRAGAVVELAGNAPYKVEMLKLNGAKAGSVSGKIQNGSFRFTIRTDARKGGVMVYLLTR